MAGIAATLDQLLAQLNEIPALTPFENSMKNMVSLILCQVKEIKIDQALQREEDRLRRLQIREEVDDLTLTVVKSEQFTRRDTLTLVGVPMPEAESQDDLCRKVSDILTTSGETVTTTDLTAVHRNSVTSKTVGDRIIPPSVTVKLSNINKKDRVLRNYKNFDFANRRPKPVKVFQSLSLHYSTVRKLMYDFFHSEPTSDRFGLIRNPGLKAKWITYQSPSAGFAFKLATGEYCKGVHSWDNFASLMYDKFPDCRVVKE